MAISTFDALEQSRTDLTFAHAEIGEVLAAWVPEIAGARGSAQVARSSDIPELVYLIGRLGSSHRREHSRVQKRLASAACALRQALGAAGALTARDPAFQVLEAILSEYTELRRLLERFRALAAARCFALDSRSNRTLKERARESAVEEHLETLIGVDTVDEIRRLTQLAPVTIEIELAGHMYQARLDPLEERIAINKDGDPCETRAWSRGRREIVPSDETATKLAGNVLIAIDAAIRARASFIFPAASEAA